MYDFYIYKNAHTEQQRKVFLNFVKSLKEELLTTDVHITLKDLKKTPTNKQRGYLRGVICEMALKAMLDLGNDGITNEDVYILLKERGGFYNTVKLNIKGREVEQKIFETFSNKGDKKRLMEFIDFCIRWCAYWLNIVIPDPSEYGLQFRRIKNLRLYDY